jgi:hypothetical protein
MPSGGTAATTPTSGSTKRRWSRQLVESVLRAASVPPLGTNHRREQLRQVRGARTITVSRERTGVECEF